jgi:hypothetical protein
MSDTIVLRKIYALDSNTGLFLSSNKTLVTDGKGGAIWTDIYSTLTQVGGDIIGYLPSTISTLSTTQFTQGITIQELQIGLSTNYPTSLTPIQLTSTVAGLGQIGYISSSQLTSTVGGLGTLGYISSQQLISTTGGLGSIGYISSSQLTSTITGLGSIEYVSTASLTSSLQGLGSILYISSSQLASTVAGLGNVTYISSLSLQSSLAGLSKVGYISTTQLRSTVTGLGSLGYISSQQLASTVEGLQSSLMNVRFDNIGNVNVTNSIIQFNNVSTLLFTSTIYMSSFEFTTTNGNIQATIENTNDLLFSTAVFNLSSFSNYIYTSTQLILDVYPTYTFTKLGSGMGGVSVLPLSTMIQIGPTVSYETTTTNFVVANQCLIPIHSNVFIDGSNVYQQPIRINIPKNTISTFDDCTLFHRMPGSLLSNGQQNGLNDKQIGVYLNPKRSMFITIQNIAGQ